MTTRIFSPTRQARRLPALARADAGAAVVEFALVFPLLATFLFGIVTYGHYFFLAHGIQQIANNAARSTIGGLTAPERSEFAVASVRTEAAAGGFDPERLAVVAADQGDFTRVSVSYDAGDNSLFRLGFLPAPSRTIRRTAAVRMGGL